jgi:DNA-binding transcriptional LysR family regulator
MRYSLRQLEVFLAVARNESVSVAARELAMSQSAVSSALLDFERQFDVLLFDRIGKRLQLSSLGRSLRGRAQALHEQAVAFEGALTQHGDVDVLRVGATLTIGNYITVPLMARFMREQPGARVTLDVANTAEIVHKVKNFEIDVGLIEGEVHDDDLEVTRFRDDELSVFCSPNHPLAKKRVLRDADLLGAPWIVRERGSGTRQAFERAMHGILPQLQISLELQHTEAIKSAVEAGLGVGCVSKIALAEAFRHLDLVPCRVPHRDFRRQLYIVLHKQKYRSAGVERWLHLCRGQPRLPTAP